MSSLCPRNYVFYVSVPQLGGGGVTTPYVITVITQPKISGPAVITQPKRHPEPGARP